MLIWSCKFYFYHTGFSVEEFACNGVAIRQSISALNKELLRNFMISVINYFFMFLIVLGYFFYMKLVLYFSWFDVSTYSKLHLFSYSGSKSSQQASRSLFSCLENQTAGFISDGLDAVSSCFIQDLSLCFKLVDVDPW